MSIVSTISRQGALSILIGSAVFSGLFFTAVGPASAATDLALAPNLSFTGDSSPTFPIEAKQLGDTTIASDRPTVIFFGTAHCWNTAREAERLVALYPMYRDRVHFVVVDLKHASPAEQRLADRYYPGYIPTIAIFDKSGQVIYDRAGETAARRGDTRHLQELIDSASPEKGSSVAVSWTKSGNGGSGMACPVGRSSE
jgi:hypothetical protein